MGKRSSNGKRKNQKTNGNRKRAKLKAKSKRYKMELSPLSGVWAVEEGELLPFNFCLLPSLS
jgi:hypothetical protein